MTSALLNKLRKQLRPTRSADAAVKQFIEALQKKIPQAVVMAGGSYAKGTFIKGSHDIDIFVRFPKGTPDATMSEAIAKALPKAQVLHGSRDYFQTKFKGYEFEIVPVQHIENWKDALNVTDMSPLHVDYIAKNLSEKQKDDVRLLKLFTKAAGIYGAESYSRGFSGYVLENLIHIYGSFENVLKATKTWNEPTIIDPAKHYKNSGEALRRLNEAKILAPLILIDPLQPDRNAAAALSKEAFHQLKAVGSKPLTKSSFDISISQAKIKRAWRKYKVIFKIVKTPKGKHDIVGAKQRVKHDRTIFELKHHDFNILHAEFRFGEKQTIAWYVLEKDTLPKIAERTGPPINITPAVQAFRSLHADAYEREGRWYTKIKRKYTSAKKLIDVTWASKK